MENKNIIDKRGKKTEKIDKILRNKKFQIIFAAVVLFVVVIAYVSYVNVKDKDKQVTLSDGKELTSQIQDVLGKIKGVGDVKVLIVYDGGEQLEIASKVDKRTDRVEDEGRVTEIIEETTTPILTNGNEPLVIGTKRAKIDGVVVVAKGGDNPKVKVAIMQALSTLLKIEYNCINVFGME
ncbi:MAG TPA: hypothetical protein PLZ09_03225 [Clostridia bacterium]|nr:hypothetical protein [Clostridia bacterium]